LQVVFPGPNVPNPSFNEIPDKPMLIKRFYDEKLAQASYLIGCQATGDALVIDPTRDADFYLEEAEREGLSITAVTETHIHADYASGSRELARKTGATMYLSNEGGPGWEYAFAEEDGATMVGDDSRFEIGNIRFRVIHTPGHTPEHICFEVTDGAASNEPMGIFTGDFIFVGDVGRPDLLEKAAGIKGTMEAGARDLYRSLERVADMPDYLQIWPGHGAGSACGKALGAVPSTTLGYERVVNWAFGCETEEDFVRTVLDGQPEPPVYFAKMKAGNRDGWQVLGHLPVPDHLPADRLGELLASGAKVVDLRPRTSFQGGHIPGTISIPFNKAFTNWAGWLLDYDEPVYLLTDIGEEEARAAARDLAFIGLDDIGGYFGRGTFEHFIDSGRVLESAASVGPEEANGMLESGEFILVDVRGTAEFEEGHIPGALHVHLGMISDRVDDIPDGKPILVSCRSGARSAIGQSILLREGFGTVVNLEGGWLGWRTAGLPAER
jgi:hydroxyacylglutathione hydrolase